MYDDDEIGLDPNPITIDDDDYVGRESETFGDGMLCSCSLVLRWMAR